ncbi:MAG TPA: tetratricopeptide repeat protein [Hyalangium sp.]|nr:tetratricopeptide repeat protein [Hyalangium sp.]
MAKSMVERYEQLLLQDPTSAVFVELAKVLLEKGEHPRAIEVCQKGLGHHPQSVIGRVLWGKALLHQGKPAEAMEQFDQAIGIDKENAHAYNLIGEVLVQRGLFRSALPILRKAAALQPNDARVKLWLDQTQQALSGGPAPVVADLPGLTANELAPKPEAEVAPAQPSNPFDAVPNPFDSGEAEITDAHVPAFVDTPEAPAEASARASASMPASVQISAPPASENPPPPEPWDDDGERDDITRQFTTIKVDQFPGEGDAPQAPPPSEAKAPEPGARPPRGGRAHVYMFPPKKPARQPPPPPEDEEELADTPPPYGGRPHEDDDATPVPEHVTGEARQDRSGGLLPDVDDANEGEAAYGVATTGGAPRLAAEPDTRPEEEVAARAPSSRGGLLGDLPPPDEEELPAVPSAARVSDPGRSSARASSPGRSRAGAGASSKRSLLEEIPEAADPSPAVAARAPAAAQVDAAEAGAAYEKELREKIAKRAGNPSFFQRYGAKIAVGAVLSVVLGVGLGVYLFRRATQGGQTLAEVLERTERVISADTRPALDDALMLLDRAQEMDDDNPRAWALRAYTYALLYADHGGLTEDRQQALAALEQPAVRGQYPGLSVATDMLVADDTARATVRSQLLESQDDSPELHTLAGTVLLQEQKAEKALEHFKRALELSSRNVRALVALGQYYQDFDDYPNALKVYETALSLSQDHPLARIGMAESRLALEQELSETLEDMKKLGEDPALPEALRGRQRLIHGRLLAELGRYDEALPLLERGAKGQGPLVFDFLVALGEASRAAGKLPKAQEAYEAALKLQPKNEKAWEGLGRALVDQDRVKEALDKLSKAEGRRVSLVRAAAYARQEDWKHVRTELEKTKVNNRFVAEAVGYLAMADAADGNGEQVRPVLEGATRASKQPRTDLRVALGRVYWHLGALDKAQAEFEEAMRDSRDYEAPCSQGRLLLARGLPDLALKPLTKAVERNGFHGEARDALGRTLLAMGRTDEAMKHFMAWIENSPDSPEAQKGYALALLRAGKAQQAAELITKAKLASDDAEGLRLRALIAFATGDSKSAVSSLLRANKADSENAETFCEVAHLYLRQGKPDDAAGAFEAARTNGPDVTCGLVGEHYAYPEDSTKAAADQLRTLAGKASTVWDKAFAQTALARVLLSLNNVKAARAAAEEAVKLDPVSGRAYLALGLVTLRERQVEQAIGVLSKAVELDPANGMARLALADVLARKQEELPRAIQEYESFLKLAGSADEAKRVRKALPNLKRRVK